LFAAAVLVPARSAPVPGPLPAGWARAQRGPAGGTVWYGVLPNRFVADRQPSAIYLPPGFSTTRRYPVLYLLHGLVGSPMSFTQSLKIARVADTMLAGRELRPMIIVMPRGADSESAEWAGAWEDYVTRDVVPWVDDHLPTIPTRSDRVLGGLCAGGYGAMDIGLRHPAMFGALEAWDGYFAPVFDDGPFVHAPASYVLAHNPTLLVEDDTAALRRDDMRFYVSVGGNHGRVLRRWSLEFATLLDQLGLPHVLWQRPHVHGADHFWAATLPSALQFASTSFGSQPGDLTLRSNQPVSLRR
jgi:enterochelin esterase-like enzyme